MLLENWYLFGEHIKIAPRKLVSVRRADIPSWKISICSTNRKDVLWKKNYLFGEHIKVASRKFGICSVTKKVLLENWYLFSEQIYLPGKLVSVPWTHEASWENLEKRAPGRKERIFSKIVSVAVSDIVCNFYSHIFCLYEPLERLQNLLDRI